MDDFNELANAADNLTFADLERAYQLMKSIPPVPIKIWCIDRPAICYQIKQACYKAGISFIDTLSSLPMIDWRSSDFDAEQEIIAGRDDDLRKLRLDNYPDKRVYPWICNQSGVWIEWNNGQFSEVGLTNAHNQPDNRA